MTTLTSKERDIKRGDMCPECGSLDTMQSDEHEYRCCGCDHGWGFDGEWYGISDTLSDKFYQIGAGQ